MCAPARAGLKKGARSTSQGKGGRASEAARQRAEREEFARLLEEDRRRAREAHRRAMEQEHQEEERRRAEQREREHRERERSSAAECVHTVQLSLAQRVRNYEATWSALRRNDETVARLAFCEVPCRMSGASRTSPGSAFWHLYATHCTSAYRVKERLRLFDQRYYGGIQTSSTGRC
jgi:hypothetical protein